MESLEFGGKFLGTKHSHWSFSSKGGEEVIGTLMGMGAIPHMQACILDLRF